MAASLLTLATAGARTENDWKSSASDSKVVEMGHCISGFIASRDQLEGAEKPIGARVRPLRLGFAFLPLIGPFVSGEDPGFASEALDRLTEPMSTWALRQSTRFQIAYIETDYFGGVGTQSAIVWCEGAVIFGPIRSESEPLLQGAINRAVRLLGVSRGGAIDEFEALGFSRYRDNED